MLENLDIQGIPLDIAVQEEGLLGTAGLVLVLGIPLGIAVHLKGLLGTAGLVLGNLGTADHLVGLLGTAGHLEGLQGMAVQDLPMDYSNSDFEDGFVQLKHHQAVQN